MPSFDYGRYAFGFDSLPLAIIGACISALYLCTASYNMAKGSSSAVRWTFFYFVLWGLFRTIGFTLRAVALTGDNGTNLGLTVTAQSLSSIGYLPLVRVLVSGSFSCVKNGHPSFPTERLQRFVSILFLVFTGLIINYISKSTGAADLTQTDLALRDVAYWGLTLFAACPTLYAIYSISVGNVRLIKVSQVILVQGILLLIKIGFSLYKVYNDGNPKEESFYYLFTVLPEYLYMGFHIHPWLVEQFVALDSTGRTVSESAA
ncbi:hypothetical protein HDU79_010320 [Rhizoclosmatium sp. JEL0117]|nr:hypothetical protein HDU79_010320 [Rhizoclosmatium sp. JEL0117]